MCGVICGVIVLISYFFKQRNKQTDKQNLGSKKYLFIYFKMKEGQGRQLRQ